MRFKDLREFVALLENRGELKRITAPVSPHLEITEITDRMVKSGGPALLFENVEGHSAPALVNIFGTHKRTALALGVEDVEELADRVRRLLSMAQGPPSGLGSKMRALGDLIGLARSQPNLVRRAPCQEVILTGDEVDLFYHAGHYLLADGRCALHHASSRNHARPGIRQAKRGYVQDAGVR